MRSSDGKALKWMGVRAPVITEKDDGSWHEGTPVELFNHKDLSGWRGLIPNMPLGWAVKNGAMANVAGANNLVSDQTFWNFKLHVEYRVGEGSNSGIGLRGRYEVQILEDYGKPPNKHSDGALYSRIAPSKNASKPAGEWQTYDIRLVGRQVTVTREIWPWLADLLQQQRSFQDQVGRGAARYDFLAADVVIADPDGAQTNVGVIRQGMLDGFFGRPTPIAWWPSRPAATR